jgi:catechol 2,3-dioxygenase-like lactoylglutathione lyase family enzyme
VLADVLHFSFTVSDIDRSVGWYTDVLGLELVNRQRQDNAYTRQLVGMADAVLEVARLKIPGRSPGSSDHLLELVQYVTPVGVSVPLRTNSPGVAHLAFLVDDIHDRHRRMVAAGVEFRGEPVLITAGTNQGGWACYFTGPDGETLELLEPAPERRDAMTASIRSSSTKQESANA